MDGRNPLAVFSSELRHYRLQSQLSQDQLGDKIRYSGKTVAAVENGHRRPTEDFASRCDAVLGTGGALLRLRELLREHFDQAVWPVWFREWPALESEASTLRNFECAYVPGLLQTEDYARAVLRTQVMATEDDIAEMVAARMARQEVLRRGSPPMLWCVIDEAVLRRNVGGREVMSQQLRALADALTRPSIVVQVVPESAGAYEGMRGPLVIASFPAAPSAAYLETPLRGQVINDRDDVAAIESVWDTVRAEALPRNASQALIEEAVKAWT